MKKIVCETTGPALSAALYCCIYWCGRRVWWKRTGMEWLTDVDWRRLGQLENFLFVSVHKLSTLDRAMRRNVPFLPQSNQNLAQKNCSFRLMLALLLGPFSVLYLALVGGHLLHRSPRSSFLPPSLAFSCTHSSSHLTRSVIVPLRTAEEDPPCLSGIFDVLHPYTSFYWTASQVPHQCAV